MITLPVPKYAVGDKVFRALGTYSTIEVQCPDCLGLRAWSTTTPAGETFDVPCGTCERGYYSRGTVTIHGPIGRVDELTIGSVQIDTANEEPIRYMCVETGVGSGTVYSERSLFLTYEEAYAYATVEAERLAKDITERNAKQALERKRKSQHRPSKAAGR